MELLRRIADVYPLAFAVMYFGYTNIISFYRPLLPTEDRVNKYKSILNIYYISDLEMLLVNAAFFVGMAPVVAWIGYSLWRRSRASTHKGKP